jgi:hypothetical protein
MYVFVKESVCLTQKESERVKVCVSVCVCVNMHFKIVCQSCGFVIVKKCVRVCVCVWKKECVLERERVSECGWLTRLKRTPDSLLAFATCCSRSVSAQSCTGNISAQDIRVAI